MQSRSRPLLAHHADGTQKHMGDRRANHTPEDEAELKKTLRSEPQKKGYGPTFKNLDKRGHE